MSIESLCSLEDVQATGALFTWSNKQEPTERVYSRLDRAIGNQEWLENFGDYVAHFHPEGLFDHCPCTMTDRRAEIRGRKSFKYFNMWGTAETFKGTVESEWRKPYSGTKMFRVVKKLKALKPVLKCLNKTCFSDIENNTNIASTMFEQIQQQLIDNPGNIELMQQEMDLANNLKEIIVAMDNFLTQKAKLQWSLEGDLNTSYFHHVIKKILMLNKVFQIEDKDEVLCTEGDAIQFAFLDYYQEFLGTHKDTIDVNQNIVRRGLCCIEEHWRILTKTVSPEEVKGSIFSIPKGKSPGPDGYSTTGSDIISRNQGAFVKGRSIIENILICQDLIRYYGRGMASPRCMFKLDLQKAYDSIEWHFVDQMLNAPKVRGIGTRKLSYAGRLVLIKSVFNTLQNYWASIFLIPKGVVRRIEAICRNYIWNGDTKYHKSPLVAWDKVCCSKKEGGLDIKEAGVWNIANVGKLVNWIYTKADRLDHTPLFSGIRLYEITGMFQNILLLGEESHDHLFKDYLYSAHSLAEIEQWLQLSLDGSGSSSKLQRKVCRVAKLACWYTIWHERNSCRIKLKLRRHVQIIKELRMMMHSRILQKMEKHVLHRDKDWLIRLDIQVL
ncbi:uncharacterized protein LOC141640492 [Silene latifolia]|uniref:uncharacterized protein LOC141640492 n=1 Tax=Silene latifolia TaxID=37657 RepID=UPI003D77BC67